MLLQIHNCACQHLASLCSRTCVPTHLLCTYAVDVQGRAPHGSLQRNLLQTCAVTFEK
jgi:hypothetical protein